MFPYFKDSPNFDTGLIKIIKSTGILTSYKCEVLKYYGVHKIKGLNTYKFVICYFSSILNDWLIRGRKLSREW